MRNDHKEVFFRVAQDHTCWIGLREPNPLADKWIGMPRYIPKDEHCKAKTSDNPAFQYAGLVADPNLCPDAFSPATRSVALQTWNTKFAAGGRLPNGYSVVSQGPEKGLVQKNGSFLFADFDLMALLRSDTTGAFLETSQAEQRQLFDKVQAALNLGLRTPMIQHGAEFMWSEGVGARSAEFVLWFGPGRKFHRFPSSMPPGGH